MESFKKALKQAIQEKAEAVRIEDECNPRAKGPYTYLPKHSALRVLLLQPQLQ